MSAQIEHDLRDWARWVESLSGFSSTVTISRAMAGQLSQGEFSSSIPRGVDPPMSWMKKLVLAMGNCLSSGDVSAKHVLAVQIYYLLGIEAAKAHFNVTDRTIFRWKKCGEADLIAEIRALD